jgi:hypothetical protein
VDNRKEILYPIGTLVKINKRYVLFRITDVSRDNLYGYITDGVEYPETITKRKEHFYRVYIFKEDIEQGLFHSYISPVTTVP